MQRSSAGGSARQATSGLAGASRTSALADPSAFGRPSVQRVAGTAARTTAPAVSLPLATIQRSQSPTAAPEPPPAIAGPSRTLGGGAVVQTSAAGTASQGHASMVAGPSVQREETVPLAPAAVAPAGDGGPGGAATGHSDRDLDELAQALFGRIRTRIRSDLIYDREAKGLTFDNV